MAQNSKLEKLLFNEQRDKNSKYGGKNSGFSLKTQQGGSLWLLSGAPTVEKKPAELTARERSKNGLFAMRGYGISGKNNVKLRKEHPHCPAVPEDFGTKFEVSNFHGLAGGLSPAEILLEEV